MRELRPTGQRSWFRRLRPALTALLLTAAACVPGGATMPVVSPSRTLTLDRGEGGRSNDGPFRVVFSGPQGEAATGAELSVVFSRPLRALDLAGSEAPPPIETTPKLEGRWQWVGTRALVFVPKTGRLPGATKIEVAVPGGTRALDGATLGAAHRFTVTTPPPRLVRSTPQNGATGLEPKTTLELRFNQPVDPEALTRVSSLVATTAGKARPLKFSVKRPDPQQPKRLEVTPAAPLPIHSSFVFTIAPTLIGEEGPLPAGTPGTVSFETYGPLAVHRITCNRDTPNGHCMAGSGLGIELTNPVSFKGLRRAVSLTPDAGVKWESWRDDSEETNYSSLTAKLRPGATYTLRVGGDLTDRHGQRMGKAYVEKIVVDDLWPTVEIGVSGEVLEPKAMRPLAVGAVNVKQYELVTAALTPADLLALADHERPEARFSALGKVPGSKQRTVRPATAANVLAKEPVDPGAVLPGAHRGPMAVGIRWVEREAKKGPRPEGERVGSDVRLLQVTDLALSAKLSRHGSLVWVTRLSDGAPVAGAKVELHRRGAAMKSYETDGRGIATVPAADYQPNFYKDDPASRAVILAKTGDDWTYRYASDHLDGWRFGVATDLSGDQKSYGMMFTERGIYRPGDAVQVKGIVRTEVPTGNSIPRGLALELRLRSPDGEEVSSQKVTASRFGTFNATVKVPKSGALGNWHLEVEGLGEDQRVSEYFEVAEYRPAEFKVSAESDRPEYVRGDRARWTARGDYLFGAPMGKAGVRYTISRSTTYFSPPGSEGFVTDGGEYFADREDAERGAGQLEQKTGKLDVQGKIAAEVSLAMPAQRGPELVTLDAEVTDVSRQALGGSTSAVVHPATFYVGLKQLDDYFVTAPGKVAAAVVALSAKGQRLPGKKVDVELVRRKWTLARQEVGGGRYHSESKAVDSVAGACSVVTGAEPASCSIDVSEGGYYLLRARAVDERKNPVEAAQGFFGIGPGGATWRDSDRMSLELALNKKSYRVGETARVLVKSPYPEAEALVTVERAGVYRSERKKLVGPTPTIEVPISDDLRPNAFVSVHIVRGRKKAPPTERGKADVGAPQFRAGYAALVIDPEARRLKVDVRPKNKELRPGATAEIEVAVKDAAGKPKSAEVTLYAVDEGVLSLIGYKTPDPLPVFTASRPLQVATIESRDSLAKLGLDLGATLGLEKGQDGGDGGGGRSARRDFRQSAYFNPTLSTDDKGYAKVSFKIPESLTTYRVMAVATSIDDRYGYGESRVVTSRRLMARPALPRFVRAGDQLDAGVVVTSKGFGPADVTVTAKVSGLELGGEAQKVVKLGRDESVEVRFPMLAKTAGQAKLRFDAKAEGEHDAVEVEREVQVPTVMEAVALYGETDRASGEKLGDLGAIRRDVGSLDLSVASTALVGLDAGVEQLVEYPYGCTEQLSSRLLPLVPLRELARDFKFPLPKNTNAVIDKTVADILGRQRGDGGFGMWPDSPESSPWVSTYALWVLHQAKTRGAAVPSRAIDQAKTYVRRYLEQAREDELWLASAAFVVDVLAEVGSPDTGYMSRLYESRKKMPLFGQALLLHALAVSKQKREMIDKLAGEVEGQLHLDANMAFANENLGDDYAVVMDSTARTSALVLRGLVTARPGHPLASKLARGLVSVRKGGTWRTTQETAFALLSLDLYRRSEEKVVPDYLAKIWLSGTELASAEMRGRSLAAVQHHLPTSKLGQGGTLVFEKQGSGTLFYEARLKYAKTTLPAQPLDRGFFVQKTLRKVTPDTLADALASVPDLSQKLLAGGDLVMADVVIVTPSPRHFVVVDDPLPAGLEAVDANLSNTAAWLRVPHAGGEDEADCRDCDDEQDDRVAHGTAFLDSWYRRELRDDRVLFFVDHMAAGMYHYRYLARATTLGKFVVPPTKAEEMYTPETFGRTGATLVEVR
ncbi:MAG: Ig-like domain-containing protein [Myxococcales bacterium]|nr:Ig-like domain-containing protein [Myxococcales bacterium]